MRKRELYHFVGIGGIGMSGVAKVLLGRGARVQGSDVKRNAQTDDLERLGAEIFIGHDDKLVNGADVVVYSSSIAADHPERLAAQRNGIRQVHRSEALAQLCAGKFTIAVTGTHGKTTTTSMLGVILSAAGQDPTVIVGGVVDALGGNARIGKGGTIVIEADESDSSFLNFTPSMAVITNIEEEHMEHFGTLDNVMDAYRRFIGRLSAGGVWFGCGSDPNVRKLARASEAHCVLYGSAPAEGAFYATDIRESLSAGRGVQFTAWKQGICLGIVTLRIPGRHNCLNAIAAIAAADHLGIDFRTTRAALEAFEGAKRRFDVRYEDREYLVVDDYAHHPTEIRETLHAARTLGPRRIVALFQPHRYSRTEFLMDRFGASFADADKLIVTDIYAASESPRDGISGQKLSLAVKNSGHRDVTFIERGQLSEYVRQLIQPGDLIMSLGAGDICEVAQQLSDYLKQSPARIFEGFRGRVFRGEPLSRHTSLKIGGPADYWLEPVDADDLALALSRIHRSGMPFYIFGAGSNILAPDEGFRGAILHLGAPEFRQLSVEGDCVIAGAGVHNTLFIQFALDQGFGGFEFLSGIPGSIGGSIVMNAGSHGQSIDQYLEEVVLVTFEGELRRKSKQEIQFGYRSSDLRQCVILGATFRFPRVEREETLAKLSEYREHRTRTQDLWHASAGCMFKNPAQAGCASGQLIDQAGLKGRTIGGAQVSLKHANFIINLGDASASDVSRLIEEVRSEVKRRFGIDLETEVRSLDARGSF